MNENSFDDEFIVELNSYLESIYILGHKKHLNDLKNDLMKLNKKDETDLNEVIRLIDMSISSNSMANDRMSRWGIVGRMRFHTRSISTSGTSTPLSLSSL